ncbi:uncharacterized protein PHACADRAFT_246032 [Phanerochaete carnosa HHB-10118-sp]|uniref:Uncharacterized protein n=1 Tax=Phanerochaete carnosa (strain HHB-10118-sp) TaxID=650164 RepID=K5XB65_PHACS|nr:uncharacterized protein PHACADRAFT_246032 [Phanerochaete carnosa HHB-10118-sp]EKM60187.1 hypothetical protein PHACADRAFT_246032 [Phanerochaete carnosa HHB-10118-sp]
MTTDAPSGCFFTWLTHAVQSETIFHAPDALQCPQLNASYEPSFHRYAGPVQPSFPNADFHGQ